MYLIIFKYFDSAKKKRIFQMPKTILKTSEIF